MKKLITLFILIMAFMFAGTKTVWAEMNVSASGSLRGTPVVSGFDYRVENLRRFLSKFNSPLAAYSEDFINYADVYGLDYRMVPAITGVESTFGKRIPHNSFNAYGWANGDYKFKSWSDSINHVSMTLRTKYIDRGAGTVAKIARRYAPPSKTWGNKVKYFVAKIDPLPLDFDII